MPGIYGNGMLGYDDYLYSKFLRPMQRARRKKNDALGLFPANSTPAGRGMLLGDLGREPFMGTEQMSRGLTDLLGQRRRGRPVLTSETF